MIEVDIVLVSWAKDENLRQVTKDAIDSLVNEDDGITYHIYVVETNREVNYDEYTEFKWMHTITTLYPIGEFGYHQNLNIGRIAGKSKYVALCNNDLTFEKGWARNMIAVMEAHPEIMSTSPWCPQTQGDAGENINKVYVGYRVRTEIAGWCIFQQRDIYKKYGMLDEAFRFWYCDNDYSMMLQILKIKHALVCKSVVNHHDGNLGKTGNTAIDERTRSSYTNGQKQIFDAKWSKYLKPQGPQ